MNQVITNGNRCGKVFAFCKAMGWNLKAYQRVTMLLLLFRRDYRQFIPPRSVRPFSIHDRWMQTRGGYGHDWRTVVIDEYAFAPTH